MVPSRFTTVSAIVLLGASTLLVGCSSESASPGSPASSAVATPSEEASPIEMSHDEWVSAVTDKYLEAITPDPDSTTSNFITSRAESMGMTLETTMTVNPDGSYISEYEGTTVSCDPVGKCTVSRDGDDRTFEMTYSLSDSIAKSLESTVIDKPGASFTQNGNGTYTATIPEPDNIPDPSASMGFTGPFTNIIVYTFEPEFKFTSTMVDSTGAEAMTTEMTMTTIPAPGQ